MHRYVLLRIICILRVSSFCCGCCRWFNAQGNPLKAICATFYSDVALKSPGYKTNQINKLWVMGKNENLFDNEWFIWWYKICIKETELWISSIKSVSFHIHLEENKTWRNASSCVLLQNKQENKLLCDVCLEYARWYSSIPTVTLIVKQERCPIRGKLINKWVIPRNEIFPGKHCILITKANLIDVSALPWRLDVKKLCDWLT